MYEMIPQDFIDSNMNLDVFFPTQRKLLAACRTEICNNYRATCPMADQSPHGC